MVKDSLVEGAGLAAIAVGLEHGSGSETEEVMASNGKG